MPCSCRSQFTSDAGINVQTCTSNYIVTRYLSIMDLTESIGYYLRIKLDNPSDFQPCLHSIPVCDVCSPQIPLQRMPRQTWPILLTELCERFSYYGIKGNLEELSYKITIPSVVLFMCKKRTIERLCYGTSSNHCKLLFHVFLLFICCKCPIESD